VWTVNGHDSSIGAGGSLFGGSAETFVYGCVCQSGICRLSVELYQLYTGHVIRTRGGWRKALKAYFQYIDFCTDNEILIMKLRANADDYGAINKEVRKLFLDPAIHEDKSR
jgi:hypothetical protein